MIIRFKNIFVTVIIIFANMAFALNDSQIEALKRLPNGLFSYEIINLNCEQYNKSIVIVGETHVAPFAKTRIENLIDQFHFRLLEGVPLTARFQEPITSYVLDPFLHLIYRITPESLIAKSMYRGFYFSVNSNVFFNHQFIGIQRPDGDYYRDFDIKGVSSLDHDQIAKFFKTLVLTSKKVRSARSELPTDPNSYKIFGAQTGSNEEIDPRTNTSEINIGIEWGDLNFFAEQTNVLSKVVPFVISARELRMVSNIISLLDQFNEQRLILIVVGRLHLPSMTQLLRSQLSSEGCVAN